MPAMMQTIRARRGAEARKVATAIVTAVAVGALVVALHADTYHTPLNPHKPGGITGQIKPKADLQTVIAVEPIEMKAYQGNVDKETGQFTFRGLPAGEYDLLIKVVGHVYEGLTLELDPPPDVEEPAPTSQPAATSQPAPAKPRPAVPPRLTRRKLDKLLDEVGKSFYPTEDYFNIKHIVRLTGRDDRARMFVVQTRTRKVVDPGAKLIRARIRRFDLVDLVKTRSIWQVVTNRHLLRQEVPYGSRDIRLKTTHSPKLGRILVGDTMKDVGEIDLKKLPKERRLRYATGKPVKLRSTVKGN
jgi:hypothetical protein